MKKIFVIVVLTVLYTQGLFAQSFDICEDGCLNGAGRFKGKSYHWSTGDTSYIFTYCPKAIGNYKMWVQSVTDTGTITDTFFLTVHPKQTVSLSTLPDVCPGDLPLDLSKYGNVPDKGYGSWKCIEYSDAVFNNTLYPKKLQLGTLHLQYRCTNRYGCSATDTAEIEVKNCTSGIQDIMIGKKPIILYPNPVSSKLTIEYQNDVFEGLISIFDVFGNRVSDIQSAPFQNTLTIDVSELSKGIYIVSWTKLTHTFSARFIKL